MDRAQFIKGIIAGLGSALIVGALNLSTLAISGSWDNYIDNLINQTRDASGQAHADKACIIGLNDGSSWTTSGHPNALKLSSQEAEKIASVFRSGDFTSFMASGIHIEGVKYQFLREEDGLVVYGKKKEHGSVTLQKSKTAIVIAHSPEGSQQGNLNKGVGVIAEYLESLNL
ncbi:MAG: DNA primase [Symploca sp. SIO3E6]|nr:DNA primase [Caldora sp. SIO3E6]